MLGPAINVTEFSFIFGELGWADCFGGGVLSYDLKSGLVIVSLGVHHSGQTW